MQVNQIINDRYCLIECLSLGTRRQTWLAKDLINHESVILKSLILGGQTPWEDLKLFERESTVLQQIDHPRIPKYLDAVTIDTGDLILVQTRIVGQSLKARLAIGKRWSDQELYRYAIDLLDILIYLHELNPPVLHRDLKPSNLILGDDGELYLVDFGAVQDGASTGATVTIVGTYGYTPIEQFGGRAVAASDLYALGATWIELATGVAPADFPQENLRLQWHSRSTLDQPWVQWLDKLTEPDVTQRYASAREAKAALLSSSSARDKLTSRTIVDKSGLSVPSLSTRVKLEQSVNRLDIVISGRSWQRSDLFATLFMLVWYGALLPQTQLWPFIAIFWLAGLLPIAALLPVSLGSQLRLTPTEFRVRQTIFGIPFKTVQGPIEALGSLNVADQTIVIANIPQGIDLQGLGSGLGEDDRRGVVQAVSEWLGLEVPIEIASTDDW